MGYLLVFVNVLSAEKLRKNCGNFKVDDGEECDEVPTNVNVSCCDRITCKLQPGAVCRLPTHLFINVICFVLWCDFWTLFLYTFSCLCRFCIYTHTHTRLTALCPGLPRWAGTRKVKPIWILLEQETVSGSGPTNSVKALNPFLPRDAMHPRY